MALSLICFGIAFAADEAAPPAPPAPPPVYLEGATVPALPAKTLQGESVDILKAIQKNYAVIAFMNTACSACRVELKEVDKFLKANDKADFFVVSVDFATDALEKYKKQNFLGGTWFHDPDFAVPSKFKISFTPGTVVLDKSGKVLAIKSGWDTQTGPAFIAKLNGILK